MASNTHLQIIFDAKDEVSKVAKNITDNLREMEDNFKSMAVKGGIAFAGIATGLHKAAGMASDLEESMNAVEVVFKDGADVIREFAANAADSVALTRAEFNQMAATTGALLMKTGKPMKDVAKLTTDLTTRAADMASVFNTDVKDAMSAINQALRGETEAIRRYAGDVTDAELETFRLSQGIEKAVKNMSQQEKVLLRLDKIMHDTQVTAGDFANTSGSLANQQRILKANLQEAATQLGESFLPLILQLTSKMLEITTRFRAFSEENPKLIKFLGILSLSITGLTAVLGSFGLALIGITSAFTILAANPIILWFGALTLAVTAIIVYFDELKAVWKDLMSWLDKVGVVKAFNQAWQTVKTTFTSLAIPIIRVIDLITNLLSLLKKAKEEGGDEFVGGIVGKLFNRNRSKVDDAIIKPDGQVIRTNPNDTIFATQSPEFLTGGNNITINISDNTLLDNESGRKIGDQIIDSLNLQMRGAI